MVDCATYRQDNSTTYACVPASALILGGLNENEKPVIQAELYQDPTMTLEAALDKGECVGFSEQVYLHTWRLSFLTPLNPSQS